MRRGAKLLGPDLADMSDWPDGCFEMMADLSLFEPNQRGLRPYDRFLAKSGEALSAPDLALAERIAQVRYSIFTYAGRHEVGGVWLDDHLAGDRRIWLMDEAFERSAKQVGGPFGMRVVDAGEFHAGFGIVIPVDEDTLHHCVAALRRGVATPFRHSIAATTYADHVLTVSGPPPDFLEIEGVLELLNKIAVNDLAKIAADPPRIPRKKKQSQT